MTVEALEKKIQELLLAFEIENEVEIDDVKVDTRNFANRSVQIILKHDNR